MIWRCLRRLYFWWTLPPSLYVRVKPEWKMDRGSGVCPNE